MATSKGGRRAQRAEHEQIELMVPPDVAVFSELFEPYEQEGGVPLAELLEKVLALCNSRHEELPQEQQEKIVRRADTDRDGRLTWAEFVTLMTRDRPDLRAIPLTKFQKVVRTAVSSVVPRTAKRGDGEEFVKSYTEHYNCCPPPLFIVIISAVELIIFIVYTVLRANDPDIPASRVADAPRDSALIYAPARRYEAWRFLTYMFIHDGYKHIISNLIFQLLLGIPLEIVHKFRRVGIVYCLGVVAGMLVGIPVLKNFKVNEWEKVVKYIALSIFIVLVIFAILFNIFYTSYYPPTDWRPCCPLPQ